jgi:hypothetical protein
LALFERHADIAERQIRSVPIFDERRQIRDKIVGISAGNLNLTFQDCVALVCFGFQHLSIVLVDLKANRIGTVDALTRELASLMGRAITAADFG